MTEPNNVDGDAETGVVVREPAPEGLGFAGSHSTESTGGCPPSQTVRMMDLIPPSGSERDALLTNGASSTVHNRVRRAPRTVSALLYVTFAGLFCAGALINATSRLIGGSADAVQHVWFLAWLPFALTHHLNPLLTSYLDHPLQVNLMWNNSTPFLGFIAWPFTATVGPIAAYNIMVVLALAGSAWTAYLAARRYIQTWWISFLVGLLYGFSPFMMVQASGSHLTLVTAFTPPLLLICLDEALVRQRHAYWKLGLVLGVIATVQLLIGEELLLTEILVALLATILVVAGWPSQLARRWRSALAALGVGAGVFAVLGAIPLAFSSSARAHCRAPRFTLPRALLETFSGGSCRRSSKSLPPPLPWLWPTTSRADSRNTMPTSEFLSSS